jgi:hypothetical protein
MSTFNHTQIKTITINVNNGLWNSETHNIVLSHDPTSSSKIKIKLVPVYDDGPITDLSMSQLVLEKFRLNK